jgi:hypothetical protein
MFISMSWRFWTHSMTPQREKCSPKRCSTQVVEGRSTVTRRSDERCILGLVMFGFWCIVVVLDRYLWCLMCWIVIYCICVCFCLYIVYLFWRLPTGEADKTCIFFKKNPYVRRGTDEHKANVAPGWMRDYVAYVRQPEETGKRKGLRFINSTWPTNVR